MAGITLEKGKAIYTHGQPMTALHLITDGKVRVSYAGGSYLLSRGDVIGICEICSEIHFLDYIVEETATFLTYPLSSINVLNDLLQRHTDVSRFFLLSSCSQINLLQNQFSLSEITCSSLYRGLIEDYENYMNLCERYRITPYILDNYDTLNTFLPEEPEEPWLNGYYLGLAHIYAGEHYREFIKEPSVSLGILKRGSQDFQRIFMNMESRLQYQRKISSFYLNDSGADLFEFYSSLYQHLDSDCEDRESVLSTLNRIASQFKKLLVIPTEQFENRISRLNNHAAQAAEEKKTENPRALPAELLDSLTTILNFAGQDLAIYDSFRKHVYTYKLLTDKGSMDDNVCTLRRVLTEEFYVLYTAVFEKTLNATDIPAPVWMFLYFGYVDEELAGTANAAYLYGLQSRITDTGRFGVYTFYHWLRAIFEGRKEPSRNEFDQDYTDFIHKQKLSGTVTETELMSLENNSMSKVNYELQNFFPTVNKMTFGRISTFCPVFIAENALKSLDNSYVTVAAVTRALERIRKADFSAFYRDTLDTEHIDVMGKIPIHVECLPDIILLPNVGVRGVMWQEIQGKRRNTSGRMCFSIFHLEDVNTSLLRMTGEFRWELCKRIQGSRWNDITERSLTSEYFDYIQFYRKNHDLSAEAKERIRSALLQSKNSFKEMFVRDYMQWILFESNGSPRLNKISRRIFFTYCPFTSQITQTLAVNPLYSELLEKYRIRRLQKRRQLELLQQKLRNSNVNIPETLEKELKYYEQ